MGARRRAHRPPAAAGGHAPLELTGARGAGAGGVAPEAVEAALARFLDLYAHGRWFDAHEALEAAWRRSEAPPMPVLQGLIQWAVAFEHHRRGNAHGARVLLGRAWSRLAPAPDDALGLDLRPLKAAAPGLAAALAGWDAGGPRPALAPPPVRRRTARRD